MPDTQKYEQEKYFYMVTRYTYPYPWKSYHDGDGKSHEVAYGIAYGIAYGDCIDAPQNDVTDIHELIGHIGDYYYQKYYGDKECKAGTTRDLSVYTRSYEVGKKDLLDVDYVSVLDVDYVSVVDIEAMITRTMKGLIESINYCDDFGYILYAYCKFKCQNKGDI